MTLKYGIKKKIGMDVSNIVIVTSSTPISTTANSKNDKERRRQCYL